MATSYVTINDIKFDFRDPDFTEVTISFHGTDNSILDTGTRTKRFPSRMDIQQILTEEIAPMKYLTW